MRVLTTYQQWARDNYQALAPVDETWAFEIIEECGRMNAEAILQPELDWQAANPYVEKVREIPAPLKSGKIKTLQQLEQGEQFCFEGQRKVFQYFDKYVDAQGRIHVVITTEAPTKTIPAQMDLYYKNHLSTNIVY